ncbi:hypothetical protein [Thermocrinis sp.]|uniref:hypothetical protein n=1 Tax=Thermocrinis sp. TaxID=2024383 RepID=UPI002FDCE591
MDYKELLIKFSEGKETPKEREFLKNTIGKFVRQRGKEESFKRRWGDDYVKDLLSEIRIRIISRKKFLEERAFVNWKYFLSIINSCLIEFYQELRSSQEVPYEKVRNPKTEENNRSVEETDIFAYEENVEEKIEAEEFYENMLRFLEERDYPILCYYLCKEFQKDCKKPEGLSEANLYKRWERLKKKLRDYLTYEPSAEAMKYFIDRFLSEVCKKLGYILN